MKHSYADLLFDVQKPARYVGGEVGSRVPDYETAQVSMALAFPDLYDIGMSHLGTKILYKILTEQPSVAVERVFCPAIDLEALLRERELPLVTLETGRPLGEFDVVGFSLQYEMTYTNVLTMLDLGGIPLRAEDRGEGDPLVLGGGPTATHPEPMAPFFDAFLIGDGEEKLLELLLRWAALGVRGLGRREKLVSLARLGGVYCPGLYRTKLDESAGFEVVDAPLEAKVPTVVKRTWITDLERYPFPDDSPVPVAEAVFDRMAIEIARGCTEGCRFCQAGMIYRPVRERSPKSIVDTLLRSIKKGGYDEVGLTSLSTADYSCISPLVRSAMAELTRRKVSLSVSSLRAYGLDEGLLDEIAGVRATGLTFAPEAGTQRLRDVINKNITDLDILQSAERVFSRGWQRIKLYFMIGLPTETEADVEGILDLAEECFRVGRKHHRPGRLKVTVSVSSHVAKPHTPFQWAAMDSMELLLEKQALLRDGCRRARLQFRSHDVRVSYVEALLARGDRRTGALVEKAWRRGARFDSWDEHFDWGLWRKALDEWIQDEGIDLGRWTAEIPVGARLPWDHIDVGLEAGFLETEWRRARREKVSPPCGKAYGQQVHHTNLAVAREDRRKLICYDCGVVCDLEEMRSERLIFLEEMGADAPAPVGTGLNRRLSLSKKGKGSQNLLQQRDKQGYRLVYTKLGRARFQGHLDTVRELPRILRRAGLELFYSSGYHPMPAMSFAPAPRLGVQCLREVVDIGVCGDIPPAEILHSLHGASPEGFKFLDCRAVRPGCRGLSKIVRGVDAAAFLGKKEMEETGGLESIEAALAWALAAEKLEHGCIRKGKERLIDLRGGIAELALWSSDRLVAAIHDALRPVEKSMFPLIDLDGVEAAIFVRRLQPPGLQPRMAEIVRAVTGLRLPPTRIVRLGIVAELPSGDLGRPIEAL